MRKLILLIALLTSYLGVSAQLLQSAPAARSNPADKYYLHADSLFRGGLRIVANSTERNAIYTNCPTCVKVGMLVIQQSDSTIYRLGSPISANRWYALQTGYSKSQVDSIANLKVSKTGDTMTGTFFMRDDLGNGTNQGFRYYIPITGDGFSIYGLGTGEDNLRARWDIFNDLNDNTAWEFGKDAGTSGRNTILTFNQNFFKYNNFDVWHKGNLDTSVFARKAGLVSGVSSFNGRSGAVTPQLADYSAYYVPLTRNINTGFGLSGGGSLSADRTILADTTSIRSVNNSFDKAGTNTQITNAINSKINKNLTAGYGILALNYNSLTQAGTVVVDTAYIATKNNTLTLAQAQTKFNGYVPTSRTVAGFPLSGNVSLGTLTFGRHLTGGSYNGSGNITATLDTVTAKTWLGDQTIRKTLPKFTLTSTDNNSFVMQRDATLNSVTISNQNASAGNVGKARVYSANTFGYFNDSTFPSGTNSAWTVTGWFKSSGTGINIIRWGGTTTNTAGSAATDGGGISFAVTGSTNQVIVQYNGAALLATPIMNNGASYASDGGYHMITFTYDGTTIRTYYDGIAKGTGTASVTITVTGNGGVSGFFSPNRPATHDQQIVVNRALSSAEITAIYNAGAGVYNPTITGKVWDVEYDGTSLTSETALVGPNITFSGSPAVDNNGKISLNGTGITATVQQEYITDGQGNGDDSYRLSGSTSGKYINQGKLVGWGYNGILAMTRGADQSFLIDMGGMDNRDVNGSVNANSAFRINSPNSTTRGTFQLGVSTTIPLPTSLTAGSFYSDASYRPHILNATTDNSLAYLSEIPIARVPLLVSANATMVLNYDYLNTTATQYTLTLPPTTGFTTDGSKIITVLATGTGGVKISVPSGYAMSTPAGAATTTGTGGATITQNQKIQLIPIGTNSYYLQPLNGTITVF